MLVLVVPNIIIVLTFQNHFFINGFQNKLFQIVTIEEAFSIQIQQVLKRSKLGMWRGHVSMYR